MITLASADDPNVRPLYPAYRLCTEAPRAMASFAGKLFNMKRYQDGIAQVVLTDPTDDLATRWSEMVARVNQIELGGQYGYSWGSVFPPTWGESRS